MYSPLSNVDLKYGSVMTCDAPEDAETAPETDAPEGSADTAQSEATADFAAQ